MPVLAEPRLVSTVDASEIYLGEEITLSVAISDPNLPGLRFPQHTPDYDVIATSSSTSFQIINGVSSANKTINFVIHPLRAGNITLPPVTITDGVNTYSTDPIVINVLAARNQASTQAGIPGGFRNSAPPLPGFDNQNPPTQTANNQAFARIEVDNLSPYLNQQITAKLKIYHRGNLRSINVKPLKLDKFIQKKDPKHQEYQEIYKGMEYLVYEIAYAIFPVKSGLVTIPKFELEGIALEEQPFNPRTVDPFRFFMGGPMFTEKKIIITAPSLALNVWELPANAPKAFSGYVGQLYIQDILKPTSLKTGESATLMTTVSGNGNFRNLNFDRINDNKLFNIYKDKENISENFSGHKLNFSGQVNAAIIPTKAKGKIKLNLAPIVIFNPASGRYEEKGQEIFELNVQYDPSVKFSDEGSNSAGHKKDEEKIILEFSQEQIKSYKANILYNEKILWILVLLLNGIYLLISLFHKIKNFKYVKDEDYAKEFTILVKQIKSALNIAEISKAVKDLVLGHENLIQGELKISLDAFLSETDMLNYSRQSENLSEEKLQELKTKALNLVKALSKELRLKKKIKEEIR